MDFVDEEASESEDSNALSSSDESEDDGKDPEPLADLINDEPEESDHDDERVIGKRRKSLSGSDEISEDDLDLIQENLGIKIKKKHKRIKIAESDDDDEGEKELIDEEQPTNYQPDDDDDEFIVDDFEDERETISKKEKRKVVQYANEDMQNALEAFGIDFTEDLLLDSEKEYTDEEEDDRKEDSQIAEPMFEPADEMKHYRRKEDHIIRKTDIPERFQLRDIPVRSTTNEEDLKLEAEWIWMQMFEKKKLSKQDAFWELYFGQSNRSIIPTHDKLLERIEKVLNFIVNLYEVPFIEHYRKEYIKPELSENELWQIYELDETYLQFMNRREHLKNLYQYMQDYTGILVQKDEMMPIGLRSVSEEDIDRVDKAQSFEELKDLHAFFSLYYGQHTEQVRFIARQQNALQKVQEEGGDEDKQREAIERVQRGEDSRFYRVAKRKMNLQKFYESKIDEIVEKFGLTPFKLSENIKYDYLRNEVNQCDQLPLEVSEMYVNDWLKTPEMVLMAAKDMLALQISREPAFRSTLREIFRDKCLVSCWPTDNGLKIIEVGHNCYTHRYLKNKPIKTLLGAMFLRIHEAKKAKLLEYRLHIDPINETAIASKENTASHDETRPWFKPYFDQIKNLFHVDEYHEIAETWNKERDDVLRKALDYLSPILYKEIEYILLKEAYDIVTIEVAQKIYHDLKIGRYKVELQPEEETRNFARVLGIAYEAETEDCAAFGALLDGEGEVKSHIRLPKLVKPFNKNNKDEELTPDLRNLLEFMRVNRPNVVAIGCDSRHALDILRDVEKLCNILNEEEDNCHIATELMPTKYAKVFSMSENAKEQFNDYPKVLLEAISIGRYLQDPLIELSQLCNYKRDILSVNYHTNQSDVPEELLLRRIEYEFINRVNQVGVDINQCISHPHTAYQLQFVAGFGPRKSVYVRQMLKHTRMENRSQLVTNCKTGPKVFINCAGFIKIDTNTIGDNADSYVEVLDGSRIHPETYEWARKMAIDALEYDDTIDGANPASALEEILESPERLKDLDLDAFADELQRQGYGTRHTTLYDIRKELTNRYEDTRESYQAPTIDEIFNWVTKETPDIFFIGKIVDATVTSIAYRRPAHDEIDGANPTRHEVTKLWTCPLCQLNTLVDLKQMWDHHDSGQCPGRPRGINVSLDNGCRGFIPLANLSDNPVVDPTTRVRKNQVVHGRILKIDPEKFWVELTTRTSDLVDTDGKWELRKDKFYDYDLERINIEKNKSNKQNVDAKKYMKRLVTHQLFRNIDYKQACKLMENADQGEIIFRPSSRGTDHLTATIKLTSCGLLLHLDIVEKDKEHEFTLGKRLFINTEEYEDLDEIQARYISPITSYAHELETFKYYDSLDSKLNDKERIACISEKIQIEKKAQPERIFYHLVASKDIPGGAYYIIIYQPRNHVHYEFIKVLPNGLRYRNKLFHSLPILLKYFKENYKNPPPKTHNRFATGSSTTTTPIGGHSVTPAGSHW